MQADTNLMMASGVKATQECDSGKDSQARCRGVCPQWDPMALSVLDPHCWEVLPGSWHHVLLTHTLPGPAINHPTANPSRSSFPMVDTPQASSFRKE